MNNIKPKELKADPIPLRAIKEHHTAMILSESNFFDAVCNPDINPATGSYFYDDQKNYFFVINRCYVQYKKIDESEPDDSD